jgi:hypothetical protein
MRAISVLMLKAIFIAVYITTSEANCDVITSGTKVGIKYPVQGEHWLGCWPKHKCEAAGCPGLIFPADKQTCVGEIFRIYKRKGSGNIQVGDEIGLYYITADEWVSAWDFNGGVSGCPGSPSYIFGLDIASDECQGEIFRVYALGKSVGEDVRNNDFIMLNYKHGGHEWLSLWGGSSRKSTCPGGSYPPLANKYQNCQGEAFQVVKLNF